MILINKNTSNNVVLTVTELIEGFDPYYFLFKFVNDVTGKEKIFTATNVSPATERYDQFTIVESTTENDLIGQVLLEPEGYWSYTIFQMTDTSPKVLNPDNAIKILEVGKVLVKGSPIAVTRYNGFDDKNKTVFTGFDN